MYFNHLLFVMLTCNFVALDHTSLQNLDNEDKVTIKFAIKRDSQANKQFPTSFGANKQTIEVTVRELDKTDVSTTDLNADLFNFYGVTDEIKIFAGKSIDNAIEIMAWIGAKADLDGSQNFVPLSEISRKSIGFDDKVTIKFAIKSASANNYKFPTIFTANKQTIEIVFSP